MDEFGDILFDLYGTTETGLGAGDSGGPAYSSTVGRRPRRGRGGTRRRRLSGPGWPGRGARGQRPTLGGYSGGGNKATVRGMMSTRTPVRRRPRSLFVAGGPTMSPANAPAKSRTFWSVIPPSPTGRVRRAWTTSSATPGCPRSAGAGLRRDPEDLAAYVAGTLGRHKVPRDVEFVAELSRTGVGEGAQARDAPRAAPRRPASA